MAGADRELAQRIMRWPLVELLKAYMAKSREAAMSAYRFRCLMWALMAPHVKKPERQPRLPSILREDDDGNA